MAPASSAAAASAQVASVWPIETRHAAVDQEPHEVEGAGELRREGEPAEVARLEPALRFARSGRRRYAGSWVPCRRGLMKGPSMCVPSTRASPGCGSRRRLASAARYTVGGEVTMVGTNPVTANRGRERAIVPMSAAGSAKS